MKAHKSASSTARAFAVTTQDPALLGPGAQAARPVHDPDLGVAVEDARAAKPEHLLPASGAPHADPIAHEVAVSLLDNVTDMNADAKFDTPFRRPARIAPGRAGPLRRAGGLERPPGHFFTSKGGPAVYGLADGFRVGVGDLALGVGAPELGRVVRSHQCGRCRRLLGTGLLGRRPTVPKL